MGARQGVQRPVASRYRRRDRGETAGRYTLEGAKRSCTRYTKKGQAGTKGANFEKRGKFKGTKVALNR